jgi:hypothetical protein
VAVLGIAAATVLTIAFVAMAVTRLNAESGRLDVAKQDAFDSIQALTLARAVSYDANGTTAPCARWRRGAWRPCGAGLPVRLLRC